MTQQLEFPTATAITELLIGDPRNAEQVREVCKAIQADYDQHGNVNVNRVRPRIPSWVFSRIVSATYAGLRNKRILVPTGEWVVNDDEKGRNVGKPQKLYDLTERIA